MRKLIVVVGPTATGKTSLAVSLCQKFNGEIISVDSRQAYREMEIGTGKAMQNSKIKMQNEEVPIHLYDLVKPDEQPNAFEYSQRAREKVRDICSRGKIPFLVGGTGFYLDVVLGRVGLAEVGSNEELRRELSLLTDSQLLERLGRLDPGRLEKIDRKNRYRVLRALEIAWQNQRSMDSTMLTIDPERKSNGSKIKDQSQSLKVKSFQVLWLGLTAANEVLYKVADARIDRMMKEGLEEEVRSLVEKYGWEAPGLKTLGYREFRPYFEQGSGLEVVIQKIKFNTHAYIRRQKTYFKRNHQIIWLNIGKAGFGKEASDRVRLFLI